MLEGSVPKTKPTISKNEKQNPYVFLAKSSICNVICISTNTQCPKATRGWKTRAVSSSKSHGKTRVQFLPLAQTWRQEAEALTGHCPTLCGQLGARACLLLSPQVGCCQVCSPSLTKGKEGRQELAWGDSAFSLSFKYVWGVSVHVCVCTH